MDRETAAIQDWQRLVRENSGAPVGQKLRVVNSYFNDFKYVEDPELYGREDYWATMHETLGRRSGDCEDLAIAKYFTLREMDLAEKNMRITYVIPVRTRRPHMVLTYGGEDEEPLVLDTMVRVLLPVSRRDDLVPVYSFNTEGYWLARKDEQWRGKRVGSAARLSRWRELLERMRREDTFFRKPPTPTGG
ncbi:MAG: hypothetical protein Kow0089_05980 [Desulfobulbaceae bacterium]